METKLFIASKGFVIHNGKILVLRESSNDRERAHVGKYDVPGGRINPGEHFDSCLVREIKEETQLDVEIGKVFFVNESWPKVGSDQYQVIRMFFLCQSNSENVALSDEHDDYLWINPKDYQKYNVIDNLFPAFKQYLNGKKDPGIWFTMGPSSKDPGTIEKLIENGATGVRLTFSYSNFEYQKEKAKLVKDIASKTGKKCLVIADLEGEKARLGDFGSVTGLKVKKSDKVKFISENLFDQENLIIPVRKKEFIDVIEKGSKILIGDGSVVLGCIDKKDGSAICEVLSDGTINPNRGIVIQSSSFQPLCLTKKDGEDLIEISKNPELFDFVALSFVSGSQDIIESRKLVGRIPIIAKIETKRGVENLDDILKEADMVMIARGDLALFFQWYQLGNIVDQIVRKCKEYKKPWIMATQVVEGLERFSFPTRAEICDLTRWTKEGMDSVLVSYETAFGSRPIDSVDCIRQIIEEANQ